MKANITVDAAIRLTEKVVTTAANKQDLNAADRLITAPVEIVCADDRYRGAKKRKSLLGQVKYWFIARGLHAIKNFRQHPSCYKQELADEYIKARIRAKLEHPFRIVKCQFGFRKTRLRGLMKNHNLLSMLFVMSNLVRARQLARRA